MSDCRFGVSPVNYPDPDPDPGNGTFRTKNDIFPDVKNIAGVGPFLTGRIG